jgi:hypothetical protein
MRLLAFTLGLACTLSLGAMAGIAHGQPIVQRSMDVKTYRMLVQVANNGGWGATAHRNYLIGLFEGLMLTEAGTAGEQSNRLFCLPRERLQASPAERFEWLESELNKIVAGAKPEAYVARIFVAHLSESYPCKG